MEDNNVSTVASFTLALARPNTLRLRVPGEGLRLPGFTTSASLRQSAAFLPFFNIFLEQRGLSGTQIGWLGSIPPLIALAAGPFWSGIADRWQIHRMVLTLCVVTAGIVSVLFLQAGSLAALMLLVIALFFFRCPGCALA